MNGLLFAMLGLLLGGLALIVVALRSWKQPAHALDQRISQVVGGEFVAGEEQATSDLRERVNVAVSKTERGSRITRDLARADLKLRAGEFVMLKVAAACAMALVGAFVSSLLIGRWESLAMVGAAIPGAIAGSFLPDIYIKMRIKR